MGIFLTILLASMLSGVVGGVTIATGAYIYLHDIVLAFGLLYFFVLDSQRKKIRIPKLGTHILLFVSFALLSLIVNSARYPIQSLLSGSLYLVRWVFYSLFYVLLIQNRLPLKQVFLKLFQFGCAFGILGVLQFALYPDLRFLLYLGWDPHYYRLFSTVLDPNFAGILLVLTVLLGYYLYSLDHKREYLLLGLFLAVCVYLTYSRSSYIALAAGIVSIAVLQKQWRALLGLAIFLTCVLVIPRPGGNTLNLLRADSTLSRLSNWGYSFQLFMQSPVLGHGFNMLRFIQTKPTSDPNTFVSHAAAGVDSSIYFLLITSGMFGFSSYVYLLYSAVAFRKKNGKIEGVRVLYQSSMTAIIVHSLFVNSLFYPWVLLWMWMLIATVELTYDR